MQARDTEARLTGRIAAGPAQLLHEEILRPQFEFDLAHLLPWYVRAEKVICLEYRRMGLLDAADAGHIARALDTADAGTLRPAPDENMSDLAFALERHVAGRLPAPVPMWHVDRSRNDLQACAQLMHGRWRLLGAIDTMLACARAAHDRAGEFRQTPMPGYTHFQAAQVMTPGFHLAALSGYLIHAARRLLTTYDDIDLCPLGAGAMAGQELAWDRDRMARLLGFAAPQPHPLTAVASRTWVLEVAAECSTAGVTLSRFITDLMSWGGERLIDLPDELSGISSAMPQKKNFPILERIRGRTAHLTSWYADAATAQRATPYSNSVEVAKEGGVSGLDAGLSGLESLLRLLTCVLERITCDAGRMRSACRGHHLGAFTLANQLTLRTGMPWRLAQVVVGQYVVAAGPDDDEARPELLASVAARHGWTVPDAAGLLDAAGDPDRLLMMKSEHASAHPAAVAELLSAQAGDLADLERRSGERHRRADVADRLTEMFAHDTEEERCATTA